MHIASIFSFHAVKSPHESLPSEVFIRKSPHESLHTKVSTPKSPFQSLHSPKIAASIYSALTPSSVCPTRKSPFEIHTKVSTQKSPLSKNRYIRIRAYSHFLLLLLWVPVGGGNGQQSIALFQIARSHMTRFDFFGVVARKPSLCSVSNAFTLIPAYFKNANI